jgi:hypothetical protein
MIQRNPEDARQHLSCKVAPKTMQTIEAMMPIPGVVGRKVDLLAELYVKLMHRHLGRRARSDASPPGGLQEARIREVLQDPAMRERNIRSVARFLHCSKSMVAHVRKQVLQEVADAENGSPAST